MLCPYRRASVVVLLLVPLAAQAEPARSLADLKPPEASARMKEYLAVTKAENTASLRGLIFVDTSKLLFPEGGPLWLYQPREGKELPPADRKTVEDGLRSLLIDGLTGAGGVLVPAAADELRQRAKFQAWYPAQNLDKLDSQLAVNWVKWYLEEAGPAVRQPLEDLIDLPKSTLAFAEGVPTWRYWPRNADRLTPENRKTIEDRLGAVLVQALGNYRGGLLESPAMEELKARLKEKGRLVAAAGGGGAGTPESGTTVDVRLAFVEKQLGAIRTDLESTRQATESLRGRLARVDALDSTVSALQKSLEELRKQIRAASGSAAPARIVIRLPEDARLYVDNVFCPLTSDTRSFDTPAIPPGQKYYYTLTAQFVRDGRVVQESQRAYFEASEEVRVEFPKPNVSNSGKGN
jgi:uncharacterized protein (TIGR03000 family)